MCPEGKCKPVRGEQGGLNLTDVMQSTVKKGKTVKEELSNDALCAMAAVDAAVKLLPVIEVDLDSAEGFGLGGSETEPPNAGSKVPSDPLLKHFLYFQFVSPYFCLDLCTTPSWCWN